jgi:hypothetical protein
MQAQEPGTRLATVQRNFCDVMDAGWCATTALFKR